jgi:hypothetical protein
VGCLHHYYADAEESLSVSIQAFGAAILAQGIGDWKVFMVVSAGAEFFSEMLSGWAGYLRIRL